MPSAAASLGLGEGVIRRLGRRQPGQVTDAYVRTTVSIITKAQARVAARVREGGADFLGEAAELDKFARYLRLKGHPEEVVGRTIKHLEHFQEANSDTGEEPSVGREDVEGSSDAGTAVTEMDADLDVDPGMSDHDSEAAGSQALTG